MVDEKIKKQALELSDKERAALAHLLIDSLHSEKENETEKVWADELKKRIDQFEEGTVTVKPWSEVRKRAEDLING